MKPWLLLALMALWPANAHAVCATCTCTASATGVAFGTYLPGSNAESSGIVLVACASLTAATVAYQVTLGAGAGSFAQRTLTGPATLAYNLYTSLSHTTVWGDGTSGTGVISDSYGVQLLTTRNYTIYGVIPSGQNVATGTYTDTILVTISY